MPNTEPTTTDETLDAIEAAVTRLSRAYFHLMTTSVTIVSADVENADRTIRSRRWFRNTDGSWDSYGRVFVAYGWRDDEMAPCIIDGEHDGAECIAAHVESLVELAQAENTARGHYRPAVLALRHRGALRNILAFVSADIENADVVYHGMSRAQTVRYATTVHQLITAELERREAAKVSAQERHG